MNENLISETSFYPIKPTSKGLIGFASCLMDDKISLNSIAIYTKPNGEIRLVFPDTYLANGKRINIFYPVNQATYETIRRAVAEKIENVTDNMNGEKSNAENHT